MKTQPVRPGFNLSALTGFGFAAQIHADEHYSYHNSVGKLLISNIQPLSGSRRFPKRPILNFNRVESASISWLGLKVDQVNENIWRLRKTSSRDAADSGSLATRISQSTWRT